MKQIRRRLTYANVMSSLAVFLILGGGAAFAATQLPKNSVGTKQLKKNAVNTAKIKKNAVTTAKIKKNAVTTAKIKKNAVTTAKIKAKGVTTAKLADGSVTGPKVNLSTLGTVPSAASLTGYSPFYGQTPLESVTTLYSTGQFDVVGICSETGNLKVPGFQEPEESTSIGIVNRGENGGYADSSDEDDPVFDVGEGVAFDYIDAGDAGAAILPNGHWIYVHGGVTIEPSENPNFGTGCTFNGTVAFG